MQSVATIGSICSHTWFLAYLLKVDRHGAQNQSLFVAVKQTEEFTGLAGFVPRIDHAYLSRNAQTSGTRCSMRPAA